MSTVLSERAAALAAAFERANDAVIESIADCSDAELQTACPGEGWPVVVVAHHLALSYPAIAGMVQLLATGQIVPPLSMSDLDAFNAQHAEDAANVTREETLQLLRENGSAAAELLRAFTDQQLDTTAVLSFTGGQPWSAADLIERGLIGHPLEHGQSIKTALGR
jgi:hypothetical protein